MAITTGAMMTLQVLLLASLVSIALSGALPSEKQHGDVHKEEEVLEKVVKEAPTVGMLSSRFASPAARAKRYIGWGRRPGLRYSKATSIFDNDPSTFNRIYNRYDKRGENNGPEAPISNFRELRMKQKVPNIQLLLPHLFNRNNRVRVPPPGSLDIDTLPGSGSDLGMLDTDGPVRLNDEDVDALMYYLEDYAKNLHGNDQP